MPPDRRVSSRRCPLQALMDGLPPGGLGEAGLSGTPLRLDPSHQQAWVRVGWAVSFLQGWVCRRGRLKEVHRGRALREPDQGGCAKCKEALTTPGAWGQRA